MARRTRCHPDTYGDLITAVAEGDFLTVACALHGLHYDTVRKWVELGTAEIERRTTGITATQRREHGIPSQASQEPYVAFFASYARARVEAEHRHRRNVERIAMGGQVVEEREEVAPDGSKVTIRKMSIGDWRASAFYLERVAPTRWGRRQSIEVTGADGGPVQVDASAGARLAARLEGFMRQVRENPGVIEGQVLRRAIASGQDGSVVFDERVDDAGAGPGDGVGGEADGAGV